MTDSAVARQLPVCARLSSISPRPHEMAKAFAARWAKKLEKFDDLKEKIDLAKVGDSVNIKVYRNSKYLDIPVRLKKGL